MLLFCFLQIFVLWQLFHIQTHTQWKGVASTFPFLVFLVCTWQMYECACATTYIGTQHSMSKRLVRCIHNSDQYLFKQTYTNTENRKQILMKCIHHVLCTWLYTAIDTKFDSYRYNFWETIECAWVGFESEIERGRRRMMGLLFLEWKWIFRVCVCVCVCVWRVFLYESYLFSIYYVCFVYELDSFYYDDC